MACNVNSLAVRKMESLVEYLENELDRARGLLSQARGESAKNAALLAVGRATEATGDRFADADEVRQFGLTVAYSVVEAALNEQPTLPACFTADDLVIASDVLAGELSRGWSQ